MTSALLHDPYGTRSFVRRWWLALVLVLAVPVVLAPVPTAQATGLHHAGLIIRQGDGQLTYAYVAFTEDSISGMELLKRTGIPVVSVSFGGLGEGVCSIQREGCPASDCRKRVCQGRGNESPFWQYFRQAAPGEWQPLVLGASSTKVHDGDVDGWSWTPKDPELPSATLEDVARLAGVPATAGTPRADPLPTAAVRASAPADLNSRHKVQGQSWLTLVGAAVVLIGLGGGVLFAIRRGRVAGDTG